jgi:hypothetical protein
LSTSASIWHCTISWQHVGYAGNRAEVLFLCALQFKPDNLAARIHLAQVKKVKVGDDNFAAMLEEEKKSVGFSENKAMSLHFALGKCYDDSGDYEHAFPHFLAGCKLKRAKFSYDPNSAARQFTGVMEISIRLSIDRLRGGGPACVPIFVLGMPCSGTILTEQIIASHPDVYGAGELHDLLRFAERNVTPIKRSMDSPNGGHLQGARTFSR